MRQINPNGFQSLCHSMYDDYFVVIKIFDFDFEKKTTFIGGMELVSLRCNRDFTSASSYGLG